MSFHGELRASAARGLVARVAVRGGTRYSSGVGASSLALGLVELEQISGEGGAAGGEGSEHLAARLGAGEGLGAAQGSAAQGSAAAKGAAAHGRARRWRRRRRGGGRLGGAGLGGGGGGGGGGERLGGAAGLGRSGSGAATGEGLHLCRRAAGTW